MPRAKRRLLNSNEDVTTEQVVNEVNPQDVKMKKILAAIPGGLKCFSVFRYPLGTKGGRPSYIDDIAPDQFNYQSVKQIFGGGRFSIEWENEDGTISKSILDIEGPRFKFDDDEQEQVAQAAQEQHTFQQAAQPERYNPEARPENGNLSALELFKLINDERKEARAEAREEMRTLLEAMRPQSQNPDVTKQVFDIVEKIVPMIGAGGGEGASPWFMALQHFKEPLTKLVDSISAVATRPAMPVHQAARPAVNPASVQPNPPTEDNMIGLMIKQYLPILINAAAKNADPEGYADLVLDQVPESQYDNLKLWLARPDCLEILCSYEQGIRYQQDWWITLRNTLLASLTNGDTNIQPNSTPVESNQD